MLGIISKDADEALDYDFNFVRWLPEGETILYAVATSSVPDELEVQSVTFSGTVVKVWLGGGIAGKGYVLTIRIAADPSGRTKEVEVQVRIKLETEDC